MKMRQRKLGPNGPVVSALGLGCMAMSEFYGPSDDAVSRGVILSALERGVTMLDTADTYGHGHNEELVGQALREWGDEAFVATKFGIVRVKGEYKRTISGRPEYVNQAAESSLKRLGRDALDLYYVHRIDETVPIEDTVGAMSDLVKAGKVRYIGLSEPSADTLRRAHRVHPVTAVQSEYSLWTRDVETDIFPVLEELGVGFVAYSPLSRGVLTGKMDRETVVESGDFRSHLPRFSETNLETNLKRSQALFAVAEEREATPAQVALAWLLAQRDDIIPIPGTRRIGYLNENIAAADLVLTTEDVKKLNEAFVPGTILGDRYTPEGMAGINK